MMMDYCAKESTRTENIPVENHRQETSVKDQLNEIAKNLHETDLTMRAIIEGMVGMQGNEEKLLNEEKCMQESLFTVNALSEGCMVMAHRIKELLF